MTSDVQHERELTRIEMQCRRWFIVAMTAIILLVATNAGWISAILK